MVRREVSSTASTKMGEAKPSLVSAARRRMHTPAAHSRMLMVISRSRRERGNIRAERGFLGYMAGLLSNGIIIAEKSLNCR